MGIRDRLAQLLREAPDEAEAVEFEGSSWRWSRMKQVAADASVLFDRSGLGQGARVGIVLENRPEHVALIAAVLATGRCVVTLSPLQPAARLSADVSRSALPIVIGSSGTLEHDDVLEAVTDSGLAVKLVPDGALREVGGAVPADATPSPGIAIEMLTSGTTGPPKRVRLSNRQLDGSLESSGQKPREGRLLSSSVGLVATPMVHIGGMWGAIGTLSAGRRIVLMPKFQLEPWVSAVERHRLRAAGLVPAALRTVLDAQVSPERLRSLQVVTSGTTACPAELADRFFRTYGIRVLMTYGATEFAGAVAGWTHRLHQEWWDAKAGSAGRPFGDAELRVTTADGAALPADETGHLEVRTRQSARGENEWVRTSDLARIDTDGFLWVVGRADDVVVRGGFKVQPDTVRTALEAHPAVREAAVAGMPDERLGAVPVAAVELEPGTEVDEAVLVTELIGRCRAELTPYEVPKHVIVVDELPRTPSTKVSRVDLVELVTDRVAAQAPA